MTALDVRNGRMSRKEADALINEFEGRRPPSLDIFLEFLEITEDQFNDIVLKLVIPPFSPEIDGIRSAPKTDDFDQWYRETK